VALLFGSRDVFDSLLDDKHFALFNRDLAVAEPDLHFALDDDERLIGVVVLMPDKVTLELDQLELVVVQLSNHLGRPVFGKEGKLLGEIN